MLKEYDLYFKELTDNKSIKQTNKQTCAKRVWVGVKAKMFLQCKPIGLSLQVECRVTQTVTFRSKHTKQQLRWKEFSVKYSN